MEAKAKKSRKSSKSGTDTPSREELQNRAVTKALFQFQRDLNIKSKDLAEILGVDTRTLSRWQDAQQIANFGDKRVREPLSNLLGIVASLTEMFSELANREAWLKSAHPVLKEVPLEMMRDSFEQLIGVRQYLEYVSSRGA